MLTLLDRPSIVIYHSDCADGFGAAIAARNYLGADDTEYYPGIYNQPPPDVAGKHVFLVDFSYSPLVISEMLETCCSILILDHHKSAIESFTKTESTIPSTVMINEQQTILSTLILYSLPLVDLSLLPTRTTIREYSDLIAEDVHNSEPKVYTYFDNSRSGAMITWEFFNGIAPPEFIKHIQDYDLWQFNLPNTEEIIAATYSYPYNFDVWEKFLYCDMRDLVTEGVALLRKHRKDIMENIAMCKRRMLIGGYNVPVVSAPYSMASYTGELLNMGEPFAATYFDTEHYRKFSLRSSKLGIDVSDIAKLYGGGGHRNSAGFTVPRDHLLAVL